MKRSNVGRSTLRAAAFFAVTFGALPAAWATPWSTQTHTLAVGDFNGDGRDDLLYIAHDAGGASGIALSDGNQPTVAHQSWPSNYLGIPWAGKAYLPVVGDFNGDGRDDVLLQRQTPGDHFVLLSNAQSQFDGITQVIAWNAGGHSWSADAHRLVAGDFNGDGRSDLFMQATSSSVLNAVYLAGAGGVFSSATQSWGASYMGFQWPLNKAVVHAGDFNNDGRADLFVQAKPDWLIIDYEVPFPVPKYRPGSFGIVNAKPASGSDLFYGAPLQIWDRNHLGGDWSAANANAVIGDFNGDGRADIFLQPRNAGRAAFLFVSDSNGTGQFNSGSALQDASLANRHGQAATALAVRFASSGAAGLYFQSANPNGANEIATNLTLASVTISGHDPGLLNNVTPGTAVGSIPGEFSVDPSGSANYAIKVAVPPGVAGLAPDLTLTYSSRGGNGPLGVGWGLSGLSGVSRCPTTMATDGFSDGADLDDNDAFCLDGQRLKVIGGVANGSVNAGYRTEIETYQRVTSSGGTLGNPASFTVRDKAGLIREYGTTNDNTASGGDSRFEARRPGAEGKVVTWAIKKISDRFGNFIEYRYDQELTRLNFWPVEITYGSNPSGSSPAVVGRVVFTYTERSDVLSGFMAGGFQTAMTKRLQKITVFGRANPTVAGANSKVREYYLNYELSTVTDFSHLESVVLCDGGATPAAQRCVKDTKFQWQHGYRGFSAQTQGTPVDVGSTNNLRLADVDGDGRNDYIYHINGGHPTTPTTGKWLIRYASLPFTKGSPRVTTNTGVDFKQPNRAITIDWNNDGYTDLVDSTVEATADGLWAGKYRVMLGGPTGFTAPTVVVYDGSSSLPDLPAKALTKDGLGSAVGDFDGDGRQDILYLTDPAFVNPESMISGGGLNIHLNNASNPSTGLGGGAVVTGYLNSVSYSGPECGGYINCDTRSTAIDHAPSTLRDEPALYVINFDGDGKDDFLVRVRQCWTYYDPPAANFGPNCQKEWHVYSLVNGQIQFVWGAPVGDSADPDLIHMKVGDFNGDGLSDLLYWGRNLVSGGPVAWQLDYGTGSKGLGVTAFQNAFNGTSLTLAETCSDVSFSEFDSSGPSCTQSTLTLTAELLNDSLPVDYDRNGVTDLMMARDGLWQVLPGGPSGFLGALWNTGRSASNPKQAMLVDDNADGVVDILFPSGLGPNDNWYLYFGRGPGIAGVVEKITDGLASQTTVQYLALTSSANNVTYAGTVYRGHTRMVTEAPPPGVDAEAYFLQVAPLPYPYVHVAAPLGVVHQFAADNGLGSPTNPSTVRTTYEYWGLKADRSGRGLLGFSRVRSWNDNSEIETINKMVQAHPYTGMVVTSEQRFRDQTTYSASLNGYTFNANTLVMNYVPGCESDAWCSAINPVNSAPQFSPAGGGYTRVSYTTNVFNARYVDWGGGALTVFPYVRKSTALVHPVTDGTPGADPYKRTVTEYLSATTVEAANGMTADGDLQPAYSDNGNPFSIRVTTSNGAGTGDIHRVTTANSYTDNRSTWCLGRLAGTTVLHEKPATNPLPANPGPPSVPRTASFEYRTGDQCVLTVENTEPTNVALRLRKTYSYDAYGNRFRETVDDGVNAITARTSGAMLADGSSSYVATQGQFPTETRNALGHRELTTWDGRWGVATSVQGPNDLVATTTYDSFGVKVRETPMTGLPGVYSEQHLHWCASTGMCSDPRSVYVVRSTATDGSESRDEFDRLGRGVMSRKLGFGGTWIYAEKHYDSLGREYLASQPYTLGQGSKCWAFKQFDALGRPIATWESYAAAECTNTPIASSANLIDGPNVVTGAGFPGPGRTSRIIHDIVGAAGIGTKTVGNANDSSSYASTRTSYKFVNVMGRTRFVRDELAANGCPANGGALSENSANCLQTEYDYDAQGNLSYTKQRGSVGVGTNAVVRTLETRVTFNLRGFKTQMVDPSMGTWDYTYNTFGELLTQLDGKRQQTVLTYDRLGRMLTRVERLTAGGTIESSTTWTYDTAFKGVGKLANVNQTTQGGYVETYSYDSFGRVERVRRQIGTSNFYTDQTYDALGRVDIVKYPGSIAGDSDVGPEVDANRLRVRNNYNSYGYLASVSDVATGTVYWRANTVDEQGRVREERLGNNLVTQRYFDPGSGNLGSIKTGTSPGGVEIQNLEVAFDQAGNLRTRKDLTIGVNSGSGIREEYNYDPLYRLTQLRQYKPATGGAPTLTHSYTYDGFGNLTSKGPGYTAYCYNTQAAGGTQPCQGVTSTRPHAAARVVTSTGTRNYTYDANGNLLTASAGQYRTATWWVSNLARRVGVSSTNYSEFTYGPDRSRFRQYRQRTTTDHETTLYAGGAYERLTKVNGATTTVEHTHYIRAGDQVITIAKRTGTGDFWFRYPHRDHLGSIVAMTESGGLLWERSGFDPWGKRTDFSTWNPPAPNTFVPGGSGSGGTAQAVVSTKRGYTGHEHVDQLGFVHMNGRIYDPELGKFFSADPTMQFPESTQGFNRYVYAGNNPLSFTDPSGFSLRKLFQVIGFMMMFIIPPGITMLWERMLWAFASGTMSSGGNLRSGLVAAATAGLMKGIGDKFQKIAEKAERVLNATEKIGKALLEGFVGGAASAATGGRFKDGFLGGFSGSLLGPLAGRVEDATGSQALGTATAAVLGGTVASIGGGKFGNGAISAAFADLYNRRGHRSLRQKLEEAPGDPRSHSYAVENSVCVGPAGACNADAVFDIARSGGRFAPGAPADSDASDHRLYVLEVAGRSDPVVVMVDQKNHTWTNVTQKGHIFDRGGVVNQITEVSLGNGINHVSIRTVGTGINSSRLMSYMNSLGGRFLFNRLHSNIAQEWSRRYE